jgi:hypothetical protein
MHFVKGISVFGLVLLSSCASLRGGGAAGEQGTPRIEEALAVTSSEAESRAELLRQVQNHIDKTEAAGRNDEERVIRKRPYFYKEYSDYTSGANDAIVTMTETESRTSPFVADVQLKRTRYATRLHRGRDAARIDDNYLRDTGTETLTYELRNGRWVRVGSFFLSETTEEQMNGSWVPVQQSVQRTVQAEEPKQGSWFSRTMSAITGR